VLDSILANNSTGVDGGGIFSYGTLTLTGSIFAYNSATDGGGIYYPGTLIVAGNLFFDNTGGDIYS
jgi:predicted outer membrane repeat protein